MNYTRRDLGKMALALPAAAWFGRSDTLLAAIAQSATPNSLINGVQIGVITYSYRSMRDQSAEATLKYVVESGISGIELMGGPVNAYARARSPFAPSAEPGRGGGGGGRAGGGGGGGRGGGGGGGRGAPDPATLTASWNGVPCAPSREGGGGGGRQAPPNTAAAALPTGAPAAVPAAAAGGGGGRGGQTPEQQAAANEERKWRMGLSMDIFKDLRKMYNDAGVQIYAVKDVRQGSDEDLEYTFAVAEALGANHVTLELPSGPNAAATLKRLGDWGARKKIYAAYHTHAQGSMTAFDEALAISPGNMANVDLGHFVAGGNQGGTPLDFLNKFHGRVSSIHLKDRTLPQNCALNLPWGTGETPIKEILQLMQKNRWAFPASIELEYNVPQGSDAVQEVRKCVDYCRAALK
jgi:sugar phosphate isomerase/epimerase